MRILGLVLILTGCCSGLFPIAIIGAIMLFAGIIKKSIKKSNEELARQIEIAKMEEQARCRQ